MQAGYQDDIIVKFAKGNYSLPLSFWGVGLSIQSILFFIGFIVSSALNQFIGLNVILIILIFFEIVTKIWLFIGIWNAGKFYNGPKVWVILSRITIVLGFGFTIILSLSFISNMVK